MDHQQQQQQQEQQQQQQQEQLRRAVLGPGAGSGASAAAPLHHNLSTVSEPDIDDDGSRTSSIRLTASAADGILDVTPVNTSSSIDYYNDGAAAAAAASSSSPPVVAPLLAQSSSASLLQEKIRQSKSNCEDAFSSSSEDDANYDDDESDDTPSDIVRIDPNTTDTAAVTVAAAAATATTAATTTAQSSQQAAAAGGGGGGGTVNTAFVSEWDKVLKTGVPNRGHASEFFAAKMDDDVQSSSSGSSGGSRSTGDDDDEGQQTGAATTNNNSDFLSLAEMEVLKEAGTASSGEGSSGGASNSSSYKNNKAPPSAATASPRIPAAARIIAAAAAERTAAYSRSSSTPNLEQQQQQTAHSTRSASNSPLGGAGGRSSTKASSSASVGGTTSSGKHAGNESFQGGGGSVKVSVSVNNSSKSSASGGGSAPTKTSGGGVGSSSSVATSGSGSVVSNKNPLQPYKPSASILMAPMMKPHPADDHLSAGVLPDVLMTMRQKIESLTLFDSDMMRLAAMEMDDDPVLQESRESLKRSSQQSISAAVLVSLAHKRYERRRLAAMEIEKVVRSLVQQQEIDRVRAILLLLSDDYVRSTSEDARKGGVVALAACAIGLKKAKDNTSSMSNSSGSHNNNNTHYEPSDEQKHNAYLVQECRDLILASVVHACQDHSQRVRYYATESLFNVVKVIPVLAIQHFFILFEILRSLYADVDVDVRSGAELLDKKLKEVIVHAMNSGTFAAEDCVPVFARFVYIRNKATKQLTLTWLQELSEKLVGAPILEFVHLFLGGIFDMIADPTVAIRQSALAFLQSVLPKLLVLNSDTPIDENGMTVDFDKILQSLVCSMEHPDPTVRKVAVYWMSRIVKAHIGEASALPEMARKKLTDGMDMSYNINNNDDPNRDGGDEGGTAASGGGAAISPMASAASSSVRTSLPHVLPGILLSVGDTFANDSFLPDQTTRALAEQTNACLQASVRRDGPAYVQHLDGFIVALREELDSPGGFIARNTPAVERSPYRMDVKQDGTGIESPGWFRTSSDTKERADTAMVLSRQCALTWVSVLYEFVVPTPLKADYAREFVIPIIHQLVDNPPKGIVYKSLEVLAKITVPVSGEESTGGSATALGESQSSLTSQLGSGADFGSPAWAAAAAAAVGASSSSENAPQLPMNEPSIDAALDILGLERRRSISRDRKVFSALIQLHSYNEVLLSELTSVLTYMCRLQPPEFVMISFSVELDRFIRKQKLAAESGKHKSFAQDLRFVSSFIQHMCHVLLNSDEAKPVRDVLMDCVGSKPSIASTEHDRQRIKVFHILLHSFAHNLPSALSLCLWSGAFRSAFLFLCRINPMDINLMFLMEIDRLVEMLERPIFRQLHIRMLERDTDIKAEGSGTMLFRTLKSLLMIIPKSTCYNVLRDRLNSVSKFRQSTITVERFKSPQSISGERDMYVARVLQVRAIHCEAEWQTIRAVSLETGSAENNGMDNGLRGSPGTKSKNVTKGSGADERNSKQEDAPQGDNRGASGADVTDNIDEQRWKLYWANAD